MELMLHLLAGFCYTNSLYPITVARKILLFVLLLICTDGLKAQYDVHFSNYEALEGYYNPATTGKLSRLNVVGAYAMQMVGFENAPKVMYIGADMPLPILGGHHAFGGQLLNDQIGLFKNQAFSIQYAYQTKMFGGKLNVGVNLGMVSETFDGSGVELYDNTTDPAIPTTSVTGSSFDAGAGLYYQLKGYYVGVSAKHLTSPSILLGESNEIDVSLAYYFMAGGNIKTKSPFLSVRPSVMLQSDGTAFRADVTGKLCYANDDKHAYVGADYSPSNSVTLLVGGSFHGIDLGYAFEWYTSALGAKSGSHELTIGYQTDLDIFKKGKNKHKSVRFL